MFKPFAVTPPHLLALAGALALGAGALAQLEPGDRVIPPVDSASNYEVSNITVDVAGKTAEEARLGAWRIAQRRGWQLLWASTRGGGQAPQLSDSALDAMVAGIVVQDEQAGSNRYVAKLGVLFDRGRAGQVLGVSDGPVQRSAPLLVVPVMWSGGAPVSFEERNPWQAAWARYRAGGSGVDYVRTSGAGADPLLLNWGQAQRRGRIWWRTLLDQYGAADVLVPQVRIERLWPGGPVVAHFTARYGPDGTVLGRFTLRVTNSDGMSALMDEGVKRIDRLYADALALGMLRPDPTLFLNKAVEQPVEEDVTEEQETVAEPGTLPITIQADTPDAASVDAIAAAVARAPGVASSSVESRAVGATSIIRVSFRGDFAGLRSALSGAGLRVVEQGGTLRVSR